MPASTSSINLLDTDAQDSSPLTRMVTWAITYGRYIMIGTEIVVLLAFISRFSLDRKLTDLKEEIVQKQAILQANAGLEKEIKDFQQSMETIKSLIAGQALPADLLTLLQSSIPPGAYVHSFAYDSSTLRLTLTAPTNETFAQTLVNFTASPLLTNVSVGDINKNSLTGIQFGINADIHPSRLVKKSRTTPPKNTEDAPPEKTTQ